MVGVGVAGCLNCGCGGTESCCIPDSFTFVWDTPSCSFDDGEVTMTKTTLDSISVNLQYKPRNGEVWIGTYLTDGMCEDDAHHVDLYIYCTSIGGVANIIVEAFCYDSAGNLLSWALGKDPDFTCDPFSFAVTTDLGSICCSCDLGGGVDSGITNECGSNIPSTLYATFEDYSGCSGFSGSYVLPLVYNSGTEKWEGAGTAPCGDAITLDLYCDGGTWKFDLTPFDLGGVTGGTFDTTQSDPLELYALRGITLVMNPDCCDGGGSLYTLTVTE